MYNLLKKFLPPQETITNQELKNLLQAEARNINQPLAFFEYTDIKQNQTKTYKNHTPLELAVSIENMRLTVTLLEVGADVNCGLYNPLLIVTENMQVASTPQKVDIHYFLLRELLSDKNKCKADINICNKRGSNPLFNAAQKGRADIVQLLIENNVDLNQPAGSEGLPPIFIAVQCGHNKIVELMCKSGANLTPQEVSITTPRGQVVKRRVDIFIFAIDAENRDAIPLLLNAKSNPSDETWQHILYLCFINKSKSEIFLELFLKNSVKPDRMISFALDKTKEPIWFIQMASKNGFIGMVKLLLTYGVDPNVCCSGGYTTLYYAATAVSNRVGILQVLLDSKKINIDQKDNNQKGNTALISAASAGNIDAVDSLLTKGADKNCKNSDGNSLLEYILRKQYLYLIPIFKTQLNDHCCFGELMMRSIHVAIRLDYNELLLTLRENGAAIDYIEGDYVSPLTIAIAEHKHDVLETLKELKVNPNGDDRELILPIVAAVMFHNTHALEWLLEHKQFNRKEEGYSVTRELREINQDGSELRPEKKFSETIPILRYALESECIDSFRILCNYFDPLLDSKNSLNALLMAVFLNRNDIISIIVESLQKNKRIENLKSYIKNHLVLLDYFQAINNDMFYGPSRIPVVEPEIESNLLDNSVDLVTFERFSPFYLQMKNKFIEIFNNISLLEKKSLNTNVASIGKTQQPTFFNEFSIQETQLKSDKTKKESSTADVYKEKNVNRQPNFFNEASTDGSSSNGTSAHHYLLNQHGWTPEKIKYFKNKTKEMQRNHKKTYPVENKNNLEEKSLTWFDGALSATSLSKIEGTHNQADLFLWLPEKLILEQECDKKLFDQFKKTRYSLSGKNIKTLNKSKIIQGFEIDGKFLSLEASHELKTQSSEARILLFPISSDDGTAKIYLAGMFLKNGLHTESDYKSLVNNNLFRKRVVINLLNPTEELNDTESEKKSSSHISKCTT